MVCAAECAYCTADTDHLQIGGICAPDGLLYQIEILGLTQSAELNKLFLADFDIVIEVDVINRAEEWYELFLKKFLC